MSKRVKDKPLYHSIADQLALQIDEGKYPPGSRLPAERELAEQFGVSRVTIREAEIALQAVGRIRIKTGSGVYVQDNQAHQAGGLPDVTAFELTEARALIEAEAAALAADHMDENTLAELAGYVEVMSRTGPDDEEGERADRDFHRTIAAASANTALSYVIESMWKMRTDIEPVKEVYNSVCSEDFGARGKEHSQILDALQARDSAAARTAMREHFTRLLESMLDATHEKEMEELHRKSSESRQRYLKNPT